MTNTAGHGTQSVEVATAIGDLLRGLNAIEPGAGGVDDALQAMAEAVRTSTPATCVEIASTYGTPCSAYAGSRRVGDERVHETLVFGSSAVGALTLHGAAGDLAAWLHMGTMTLATHIGSLIVAHTDHAAAARAGTNRDVMLASVSHELRTPLTFITGIVAELIDGRDLSRSEQERLLDMIAEQSADMERIIDDLLADGQVGAKQLELSIGPIDLAAEARRVAESARIEVSKLPVPGQTLCLGDERRVRQILRNLLTNAQRYGGPIITMSSFRDLRRAYLAVCDNGAPIPIDQRRHLFEDFTSVDAKHRHPASVGIGLSVARRLASLMGGSLGYEHDGRQSRFILGLPLAEM